MRKLICQTVATKKIICYTKKNTKYTIHIITNYKISRGKNES